MRKLLVLLLLMTGCGSVETWQTAGDVVDLTYCIMYPSDPDCGNGD